MPRDPFEYYPISRSCCETAASVSCTGLVEAASSAMLRHTIPTRFLCFRSSVVIDAAARYPPTHTALARAVRSCPSFFLSPLSFPLHSTLYYTISFSFTLQNIHHPYGVRVFIFLHVNMGVFPPKGGKETIFSKSLSN